MCRFVPCSFDLIFLDANKDGYQTYYNIIMEQQLLAPSGLLVVDNTLMKVNDTHSILPVAMIVVQSSATGS